MKGTSRSTVYAPSGPSAELRHDHVHARVLLETLEDVGNRPFASERQLAARLEG